MAEKETHDRGVPDSAAQKQDRTLEERVAFIEHRLGLIKTIEDHEFAASEQTIPPAPTSPGNLYSGPDADEQLRTQLGDAAPADVGGKTKEELLDEARALDIEGRSSMAKDELAAAIASAKGGSAE